MSKTEQKIIKFISQHQLIDEGDKLLIALSGGSDSVFALHLHISRSGSKPVMFELKPWNGYLSLLFPAPA